MVEGTELGLQATGDSVFAIRAYHPSTFRWLLVIATPSNVFGSSLLNMMLRLYAGVFRAFKTALLSLNRPAVRHQREGHDAASPPQITLLDAKATLLGDAYRGSGVLIGSLGALIVFCAIAPLALLLGDESAMAFGIAEVAMMALVIYFLLDVRKLKSSWLDVRSQAESERYGPILEGINGTADDLRLATQRLLGGEDCQIRYNHLKHEHYHHMEQSANRLGAFGFGVSLVAAIGHLAVHAPWLILFTAFLPALVGALHGINSFLQLGQLSEDHRKVGSRLREMSAALDRAFEVQDIDAAKQIASAVHGLLATHHTEWRGVAERITVRAP